MSVDTSIVWTERQPAGNLDAAWTAAAVSGTRMIAAVENGRVYLSSDAGASWTETHPASGNQDKYWNRAAIDEQSLIIGMGSNGGRLYISTNFGTTWTEARPLGNVDGSWWGVAVSGDIMVACNHQLLGNSGLWLSTNKGSTWSLVTLPGSPPSGRACACAVKGSTIVATYEYTVGITTYGNIYVSTDSGSTWTEVEPAGTNHQGLRWYSCAVDGSQIIANIRDNTYYGKAYVSHDTGATWSEAQPAGPSIQYWLASAVSGTAMFSGASGGSGRLYVSFDDGSTWYEARPAGDTGGYWDCCSLSGTSVIAGLYGKRLYTGVLPSPSVVHSFPWVGRFQLCKVTV